MWKSISAINASQLIISQGEYIRQFTNFPDTKLLPRVFISKRYREQWTTQTNFTGSGSIASYLHWHGWATLSRLYSLDKDGWPLLLTCQEHVVTPVKNSSDIHCIYCRETYCWRSIHFSVYLKRSLDAK